MRDEVVISKLSSKEWLGSCDAHHPPKVDALVCFLPHPAFGNECDLTDSDLYQRFPDVFPRFSNNNFSSLLLVEGDEAPSVLEYSNYEIPVSTSSSPREVNCEEPPAARRPKSALSSVTETFTIMAPASLAHFVRLPDAIIKLKDVSLPTQSKMGFVVSLFGGALHLSYPPTAEQLQLYAHVIRLYELCGFPDHLVH